MSEDYRGFGDYILFHEIHRSAFGTLYRAAEVSRREKSVQRTVFLQVFDSPAVSPEAIMARREIANQIGQVLRSSNTASSPLLSNVHGTPVLAYDYVPALPLAAVLERARAEGFPIAVDNALLIMEKLSTALSSALAVDVGTSSLVHGCLHPALVAVTNEGEGVVAGFGLGESLLSVVEDQEAYPATAPYLAPEVVMAQSASKQGDVYSLGAILYELLTGQALPADPAGREAALAEPMLAFEEEPIPADILTLMRRALAAKPDERFSSAADFKKELDKLLYGGAYSPTTFNLALFMDRLFRAEIEAEERSREAESQVDVEAYLKPEPEPVEVEEVPPAAPKKGASPVLWGVVAVAVIAVAVVAALLVGGGGSGGDAPPTPTPEEIAAREAEQDRRMREMVDTMVKKLMEEKEAEYRAEMQERQQDIIRLREQLAAKEREAATSGGDSDSDAAARQAKQLREELEKAEEAKKAREAELEAERQRRLEQARKEAAKRLEKTPVPEPQEEATAAVADTSDEDGEATPHETDSSQPADASSGAADTGGVTEGAFVPQGQWDSAPVRLASKRMPEYPRQAERSRRRGVVILKVTVGANGAVDDVEVLRADHDGFGIVEAIVDTVRDYRYKPAMKDGVRVKTTVTETYRYDFTK